MNNLAKKETQEKGQNRYIKDLTADNEHFIRNNQGYEFQ
jgi:hypothetical protein